MSFVWVIYTSKHVIASCYHSCLTVSLMLQGVCRLISYLRWLWSTFSVRLIVLVLLLWFYDHFVLSFYLTSVSCICFLSNTWMCLLVVHTFYTVHIFNRHLASYFYCHSWCTYRRNRLCVHSGISYDVAFVIYFFFRYLPGLILHSWTKSN